MGYKLGMNCVAYRSAALLDGYEDDVGATKTPSTATWVEAENVKDVNSNLETGEADMTTRKQAKRGWRSTAATLNDGSIDFEMLADPDDETYVAIRNAWKNKTEIAMMFLDEDVATPKAQGPAGNWSVSNFSRSEPLEEGVVISVTLRASTFVDWYEVPGGA